MLTKLPVTTFVPGVAGQAAAPAYTWCSPSAGDGTWEYTCYRIDMPEEGGSVAIPPGGQVVVVYDTEDPTLVVDVYISVCASTWVASDAPIQPPVCYDVPAQEFIAYVPPRYDITPDFGWNAGGNSIDALDGDVRLAFTMDAAIGVGVGFVTDLENIGTLDRILFGFYFHQTMTGDLLFNFVEDGRVIGEPLPYETGDAFEIQRGNGSVSFLHADVRLRTSRTLSSGPLNVGSAFYASGDTI